MFSFHTQILYRQLLLPPLQEVTVSLFSSTVGMKDSILTLHPVCLHATTLYQTLHP